MGKQGSLLKRLTDVIISIVILLVFLPILIICAILIKLDSKGPVFFVHERTGLNGKNFKMFKFRGMIDKALTFGPELTQVNDPRLTRMGKFMRRTSIDEIPNFINVIIGDMSIIGPRPEMPSITKTYNDDQRKIFSFIPGVSGFSQVNGRQLLTPEQRVKMEINYYKNENFISDIILLFKTLKVVVTNQGNL